MTPHFLKSLMLVICNVVLKNFGDWYVDSIPDLTLPFMDDNHIDLIFESLPPNRLPYIVFYTQQKEI